MNTSFTLLRKTIVASITALFLLSAPAFAQSNYALSMNGTSTSYANLGTINPTGNFSTGLTIECWVKWGSFNSWSRLLDMGNGEGSNNILFANQGTSNNLRFEIYTAPGTQTGISGPANLVAGRWYHVAVTVDGSGNARMYTDGVQVASGTLTGAANVSRTLCYIGKSNWAADGYLNGTVDEMRIWNVARAQGEIKSNMFKTISPASPGLVAYYKCNENGGTTLINSKTGAGAVNGTTAAALSWTDSPAQFAANAIQFDGTNDFVTIPDNNTLDISNAITLEAWVYATKNTGVQNVICKSSGTANTGYIFPRTNDGWANAVIYLYAGGNWRVVSASYPSLNAWHHLAATYDGATIKMYIDGVQVTSVPQTGTIAVNTNPLTLGTQPASGSEYFGGTADEFRVWNVARTQAEIQASMNSELDPSTPGLVSYYTANQGVGSGNNGGLVTLVDQAGNNNGTFTNFALSGSSSNYVEQNSAIMVLPVEWRSFTAQPLDSRALLQWSTASEQNTKDFVIQHSSNGTSWNDIGRVVAAGNSNTENNYRFVDAQPLAGLNYYRIRQEDIDARYSYSKVVAVRFNGSKSSFTVRSNPTSNGIVQLGINSAIVLNVYTSAGRLIKTQRLQEGTATIDLRGYAKGMYLLQAGNDVKKVLLQ